MHAVYPLSDLAHAVSDSLSLPLHEAKECLEEAIRKPFDTYNPNNNQEE